MDDSAAAIRVADRAKTELTRARRRRSHLRLGRETLLGYLLISPAVLYILLLVAYPFGLAVYYSLSNATVAGGDTDFVGFTNYTALIHDSVFRKALTHTLIFTFVSQIGKATLGIGLAFLLLRPLAGKKIVRVFLMLPWTLPISLSILAWRWMYDPQFSVINYVGGHLGIFSRPYPDWLGDPTYAFIAVLIVNIWRGFPFTAIIILAGLTSIPQDIYDAAKVDGAGFLRRWHSIITPMIAPILFIGLIFDVVFTIGDLSIVLLLTNGGPVNATDILPTVAYHRGIVGGNLAAGAATALFLFPILFVVVILFLRSLRRREV